MACVSRTSNGLTLIFEYAMPKILYNFLLTVFLAVSLLSGYAAINLGASIKYETEGGCISVVDGTNLCRNQTLSMVALIISLLFFLSLLILRARFLKKLSGKA